MFWDTGDAFADETTPPAPGRGARAANEQLCLQVNHESFSNLVSSFWTHVSEPISDPPARLYFILLGFSSWFHVFTFFSDSLLLAFPSRRRSHSMVNYGLDIWISTLWRIPYLCTVLADPIFMHCMTVVVEGIKVKCERRSVRICCAHPY